jgi:hypothetical protein
VSLDKEKSPPRQQVRATNTFPGAIVTLGKKAHSLLTVYCTYWHSAKKHPVDPLSIPLPSVLGGAFAECPLDKLSANGAPTSPFVSSFAECALVGTRQRLLLCRVSRPQHSTKKLY